MHLGPKTMWSMSIATMGTFVGAIWMASLFVHGKIGLIDRALAETESLKVEQVQHDIEHERDFRLELRSYLRKNPGDEGAQEDLDEVEDDLEDLREELKCLREDMDNC